MPRPIDSFVNAGVSERLGSRGAASAIRNIAPAGPSGLPKQIDEFAKRKQAELVQRTQAVSLAAGEETAAAFIADEIQQAQELEDRGELGGEAQIFQDPAANIGKVLRPEGRLMTRPGAVAFNAGVRQAFGLQSVAAFQKQAIQIVEDNKLQPDQIAMKLRAAAAGHLEALNDADETGQLTNDVAPLISKFVAEAEVAALEDRLEFEDNLAREERKEGRSELHAGGDYVMRSNAVRAETLVQYSAHWEALLESQLALGDFSNNKNLTATVLTGQDDYTESWIWGQWDHRVFKAMREANTTTKEGRALWNSSVQAANKFATTLMTDGGFTIPRPPGPNGENNDIEVKFHDPVRARALGQKLLQKYKAELGGRRTRKENWDKLNRSIETAITEGRTSTTEFQLPVGDGTGSVVPIIGIDNALRHLASLQLPTKDTESAYFFAKQKLVSYKVLADLIPSLDLLNQSDLGKLQGLKNSVFAGKLHPDVEEFAIKLIDKRVDLVASLAKHRRSDYAYEIGAVAKVEDRIDAWKATGRNVTELVDLLNDDINEARAFAQAVYGNDSGLPTPVVDKFAAAIDAARRDGDPVAIREMAFIYGDLLMKQGVTGDEFVKRLGTDLAPAVRAAVAFRATLTGSPADIQSKAAAAGFDAVFMGRSADLKARAELLKSMGLDDANTKQFTQPPIFAALTAADVVKLNAATAKFEGVGGSDAANALALDVYNGAFELEKRRLELDGVKLDLDTMIEIKIRAAKTARTWIDALPAPTEIRIQAEDTAVGTNMQVSRHIFLPPEAKGKAKQIGNWFSGPVMKAKGIIAPGAESTTVNGLELFVHNGKVRAKSLGDGGALIITSDGKPYEFDLEVPESVPRGEELVKPLELEIFEAQIAAAEPGSPFSNHIDSFDWVVDSIKQEEFIARETGAIPTPEIVP